MVVPAGQVSVKTVFSRPETHSASTYKGRKMSATMNNEYTVKKLPVRSRLPQKLQERSGINPVASYLMAWLVSFVSFWFYAKILSQLCLTNDIFRVQRNAELGDCFITSGESWNSFRGDIFDALTSF